MGGIVHCRGCLACVLGLLTLRPRKGGETNDGSGLGQDSEPWNPVHAVLY